MTNYILVGSTGYYVKDFVEENNTVTITGNKNDAFIFDNKKFTEDLAKKFEELKLCVEKIFNDE